MNLAEVTFDQIREATELRLNDFGVSGIAVEVSSREFALSYFKNDGVFDYTFQISPPTCRDQNRFFEEIVPLMRQLDEMLMSYRDELNTRFRKEYIQLLKQNSMVCV